MVALRKRQAMSAPAARTHRGSQGDAILELRLGQGGISDDPQIAKTGRGETGEACQANRADQELLRKTSHHEVSR